MMFPRASELQKEKSESDETDLKFRAYKLEAPQNPVRKTNDIRVMDTFITPLATIEGSSKASNKISNKTSNKEKEKKWSAKGYSHYK